MRALYKSISYRILGTMLTCVTALIVTGSLPSAVIIGGVEVVTKIALYYVHEKIWERI